MYEQVTTTPTRELPDLIELYEGNYRRLQRLIPDLDHMNGVMVSRVAGAMDLYLAVQERFKYTTTLTLSYRFKDYPLNDDPFGDGLSGVSVSQDYGSAIEPNARICVYHDVRAVEVLSHSRRRRTRKVRPWVRGRMPEVERKWEMNRFLYKWLRFCTHQGHIFLACTAHPAPEFATELARMPSDTQLR